MQLLRMKLQLMRCLMQLPQKGTQLIHRLVQLLRWWATLKNYKNSL